MLKAVSKYLTRTQTSTALVAWPTLPPGKFLFKVTQPFFFPISPMMINYLLRSLFYTNCIKQTKI